MNTCFRVLKETKWIFELLTCLFKFIEYFPGYLSVLSRTLLRFFFGQPLSKHCLYIVRGRRRGENSVSSFLLLLIAEGLGRGVGRLDFRRSLGSRRRAFSVRERGSFPEKRLVIEPKRLRKYEELKYSALSDNRRSSYFNVLTSLFVKMPSIHGRWKHRPLRLS